MSDFHPEWFGGNEEAARFVAQLCDVAHTWDDLIDRDTPVSEEAINRCFESALLRIPANPFYQTHFAALSPLLFTGVLGYLTANRMERSGDAHQIETGSPHLRGETIPQPSRCLAFQQPRLRSRRDRRAVGLAHIPHIGRFRAHHP